MKKASNQSITVSQSTEKSDNLPPLWIKQAGLEWFYVIVSKLGLVKQ